MAKRLIIIDGGNMIAGKLPKDSISHFSIASECYQVVYFDLALVGSMVLQRATPKGRGSGEAPELRTELCTEFPH